MRFTLEALEAKHGDSLILHYGDDPPRFIVIDGGPGGVWDESLRPRLEQLRKRWCGGEKALPIEMLMVSHIDDDHINGVLGLTDFLVDQQQSQQPQSYEIGTMWFNSFDDLLSNSRKEIFSHLDANASAATVLATLPPDLGFPVEEETAAVVASVGQGQRLRHNMEALQITPNEPYQGLVMRPADAAQRVEWDEMLLTVLGPDEPRIRALQKKWDAAIRSARRKKKKKDADKALAAAYSDRSVFNLASIVVLVECEGKRILLTGDARGDYILDGLKAAGLIAPDKTLHVDLLKLPHHGSDRNIEEDFFRQVTADHYVVSANGKHENPDISTLQWIDNARGRDKYRVHLTNRDGEHDLGSKLQQLFEERPAFAKKCKFRRTNALSLKVDLLDPVEY